MPSATALARLMTRMDAARYSMGEVTALLRRGFDCTTIADISEEQAAELTKHMERVEATRHQLESDWVAAMRQAAAAKQRELLDEGINAQFDDDPDPELETDADRYRGKPEPPPYNVHDNTIGFEIIEADRWPEEPFLEPDDMPLALQERAPVSSAPPREQVVRTPAEPSRPVTEPRPEAPPQAREPDKTLAAPVKSPTAPSVRPPQFRPPARQVQPTAKVAAQTSAQPTSQASEPRSSAGQSVRPQARQPSAPASPPVLQPSRPATGSPKPSERTTAPVAPATWQVAGTSAPARSVGPPPGMMPRRSGFLPTTPVALADISPEALARATPDNPAIKTRVDPPPVSSPPIQQSSSAPADQATIEAEPPRHIRRPKWLVQLRDEDPPD